MIVNNFVQKSSDCALLLQAIAGHDSADASSSKASVPDYSAQLNRDLRGVRFGVVRHFWEDDLPLSSEAIDAIEHARRLTASRRKAR
ncbi:MAG: hypothetical protein H0V16_11690 [Burkholderiaceae bacterium]|nr:hypothetical protein [Burkholderiaceae bacterium]